MQANTPVLIEITVNGESRTMPAGAAVQALLDALGIHGERVAVELNRRIVKRERWADTVLDAGARVEIVQFVGGG